MRTLGLISATIVVVLTLALWAIDPSQLSVTLASIAWVVGLGVLAVAVIRTGAWVLQRVR